MPDVDRYTREYLRDYGERSFERHLAKVRLRQVLASIARYPHQSILEIGCGPEPVFPYVGFRRCTVVEPSEEFVQHARRVARGRGEIVIVQGRLEDVADMLSSGAYDFVIASSVLHEVPDPRRLLQIVRSLCGPATTVHINVPNVYSFHRLLALEMGLVPDLYQPSEREVRFQRHTRFDGAMLRTLVEEQGFRVLSFGTYFVKPFTNRQMEAMLEHGVIDEAVLRGLEQMTKHLPEMGCEMYVEARKA